MDAVKSIAEDRRLRRIHFDWLEAGEHTQRTVASLSQQLRRYLDNQAYLENKRIMEILDSIAKKALQVKECIPSGNFMTINDSAPDIRLPMERPLYTPPLKVIIDSAIMEASEEGVDLQKLYDQVYVDKSELQANIQKELQTQDQITLSTVIEKHPLSKGLAELITYLTIASENSFAILMSFTTMKSGGRTTVVSGKRLPFQESSLTGIIMVDAEKTDVNNNGFSVVMITLLKGVVYADENVKLWQNLLSFQARIRDYVREIGLELVIYEDEGFAWLQTATSHEGQTDLPRLVMKRPLSYPVSLLLALLRQLAEHDASSSESRLILGRDEIVEMVKTFLPSGSNEARLVDQIDTCINKVIELGFARRLRSENNKIEVRRLLKAFVDAQWLNDFDTHLKTYLSSVQSGTTDENGE